jgi:prolyl-tRNA editing enzyme YbaK/EbsC (Cys-tRNA(Pro) deacylase)
VSDRLIEEHPVLAAIMVGWLALVRSSSSSQVSGFSRIDGGRSPASMNFSTDRGTHKVVRTLVVQVPDRLVLVCLRAEDELDYGKLAGVLGIDRDPITLAAPGRVTETLEVDPGFETILTDANIDRFLDEKVLKLDKVLISSGRNDRLIELRADDLASVSKATIAELAVEQPS